MVIVLRAVLFGIGVIFLSKLTLALLSGQITYTIGDVDPETVVTKTIFEAFAIWLTFGSMFAGMMIAGAKPQLYTEKPWLWKVLLALAFSGYILSSVFRSLAS